MPSISRRIYRSTFALMLFSIVIMVITLVAVNESLESTMLNLDFSAQRDFIKKSHNPAHPMHWKTATMSAIYLPQAMRETAELPAVFRDLPANYAGEIEQGDRVYLINVTTDDYGRLYFARDITLFEQRENLFARIVIVFAIAIAALHFILSIFASRRITRPLRLLTQRMADTPIGSAMPRLTIDYYEDEELRVIALTFNDFLKEIEAFVKREHDLVNMASHELRTPASVIIGAVDVLESRDDLNARDQHTLRRIKRTANEMRANIEALLTLARRPEDPVTESQFSLPELLEEVLEDLSENHLVYERINLGAVDKEAIYSDRVMAKILFRNLIHNALEHTRDAIKINVYRGQFEIIDEGSGLVEKRIEQLRMEKDPFQRTMGGFGLYIVTLVCDRLGWRLLLDSERSNTIIRVIYDSNFTSNIN